MAADGSAHDVTATALLYFAAAHICMAAQACFVAVCPPQGAESPSRQAGRAALPPALVLPPSTTNGNVPPSLLTAPASSLRHRTSGGSPSRTPHHHQQAHQEHQLPPQLSQQDEKELHQGWVSAHNQPASRSVLRRAGPAHADAPPEPNAGDTGDASCGSGSGDVAPRKCVREVSAAPAVSGGGDPDGNGVGQAEVQRRGSGLHARSLQLAGAEPVIVSSAVDSSGSIDPPVGVGAHAADPSSGSGSDAVAVPQRVAPGATAAVGMIRTSGDGYVPEPTSMPSRSSHSFPFRELPATLSTPADRATGATDGSSAVSAPGADIHAAATSAARSLPQLRILSDTQIQSTSSGSQSHRAATAASAGDVGRASAGVEALVTPAGDRNASVPPPAARLQRAPADSFVPQQPSITSSQRSLQGGAAVATAAAAAAVLAPRHSALRQRHSLGPRRSGGLGGGPQQDEGLPTLGSTRSAAFADRAAAGPSAAAGMLELWLLRRGLACAMAAVVLAVYLRVLLTPTPTAGGPANAAPSVIAAIWQTLRALPSLLCIAALAAVNGAVGVSALLLGGRPLHLGPLAGLLRPPLGASPEDHSTSGAAAGTAAAADAPQPGEGSDVQTSPAAHLLPLAALLRWEWMLRTALPAAMAVATCGLYGPESPCSTDHMYLWLALQPATGEVASVPIPSAGQGASAASGGYSLLSLAAVLPMQLATALAARAAHTLLASQSGAAGAAAAAGSAQSAAGGAGKVGLLAVMKALVNLDPRHLPEYGFGAALALGLRAVLLSGCAVAGVMGLQPERVHSEPDLHQQPQHSAGDVATPTAAGPLAAETSVRSAASTHSSRKLLITGSGGSNTGTAAVHGAQSHPPASSAAAARPVSVATAAAYVAAPSPRSPTSGPQPFSSPLVQGHTSSPSARSPHAVGPDGLRTSSGGGPWGAGDGAGAAPPAATHGAVPQTSAAAAAVQARMARRAPPRSSSFNLRLSLSYGSQVLASALSPITVGAIAALRDATGTATTPTPSGISCRQSATSVISEQLEALLDLKRLSTTSSLGPGAAAAAVAAAAAAATGAEGAGQAPATSVGPKVVYVRARSARRRRGSNASVDNGGIALYRQQLGALLVAAGTGGGGGAALTPRHGVSPGAGSRLSSMHADLRGGWASDAHGDDGEEDEEDSEEGVALALQAAEVGAWGRRQHGSMPSLATILGGGSGRSRSRPGSIGGGFSTSSTPRSPLHRAGEALRPAAAPLAPAAAVQRGAGTGAATADVVNAANAFDSSLSRRSLRKLASMPSRLRSSAAAAAAAAAVAAVEAEVAATAAAKAGHSYRTGDGGLEREPVLNAGKSGAGPLGELWRRQRAAAAAAAASSAPRAPRLSRGPQVQPEEEGAELRQNGRDGVGSSAAASPLGLAVELGLAAAAAATGTGADAGGGSRGGAAANSVPLTASVLGAEQDLRREALRSLVLAKWRSSLAAGTDGNGAQYGLPLSPYGAAAATAGGVGSLSVALPGSPQGAYVVAEGAAEADAGEEAEGDFENAMVSGMSTSVSAVLGTTGTLCSPRVSAGGNDSTASGAAGGITGDFGLLTSPHGRGATGAGIWTARSTAAAAAALAEVAAAADELVILSPRSGAGAGSVGGGGGGLAAAASIMSPQLSGMLSYNGTGIGTGNASALTGNSRRSLGISSRNTSIKTSVLSRNSSINYGQPGGAAAGAGVLGLLSSGVSTKSLLSSGAAAAGAVCGGAAVPCTAVSTPDATATQTVLDALRRWWLVHGAPRLEAAWLGEAGALLLQLAFSPRIAITHTLSSASQGVGSTAWAVLARAPQVACVAHLAAMAAAPEWCEARGPALWAARAMMGPALQRGALAALGLPVTTAGPLHAAWEAAYMTAALRLTAPQHGSLVLATTAALALVTLANGGAGLHAAAGGTGAVGALWYLEAALRHAAGLLAASTVGAALGLLATRVLPAAAAGLLASSALRRQLSPPRAAAVARWSATLSGDSEATASGAAMAYLLVSRAALLRAARVLRAAAAMILAAAAAAAGALLSAVLAIAKGAGGSTTNAEGSMMAASPAASSYNLRWRLRRWLLVSSAVDTAATAAGGAAAGNSGEPSAAAGLVAALPSRTPAAVAVGAVVALLVALAAAQALILAVLTGDGRRVSRFHRRQAALMGLKGRLLAAPTVLELLTELTMSTDQLLEGCSAWTIIVPTSNDAEAPGDGRGSGGAAASSGVLLELRLHPDLQVWPGRAQPAQAEQGAPGAAGSDVASPEGMAAVAAAERDREAEKRRRAERRRMQMLRRRQPRPPSRTGAAPQLFTADSVEQPASAAGGTSELHLLETVTSIIQESEEDDVCEDSSDESEGHVEEGELPRCGGPGASSAAAASSTAQGGEAAGDGAGRAPSVQLANFPSLQLAMIHRTIWSVRGRTTRVYGAAALSDTLILQQPTPPDLEALAAAVGAGALLVMPMECLFQSYGLLVVATAHPAAADRHLRLLCQGLADGLAQALYLKQLQADVAASDMIMKDIYPSAQVVQVVKRRFHAAGAASQRLMMPGSASAAAAAAAAASSGSPAANSLSGLALGAGGSGHSSAAPFGAGVKAALGGGSYVASPNASTAGAGAASFRSPMLSASPYQHHLASVSSPSFAVTSLPRFGSSSSAIAAAAAAAAAASAGIHLGGVGLAGTAPGSGPDSAGPVQPGHAGPLLEGASTRLASAITVDVTGLPGVGLLVSSNSIGVPSASPVVPGGSGSGPGSATPGVTAHSRGVYAAVVSAFSSGPAATLGGIMSFGRADSAPIPAAALVAASGASAASGLGQVPLGASRLSLDPHNGTNNGASRSQTMTPSQAAAVAAAAGLGTGVSNSAPGGPVSMGGSPSPLPAVAAVACALAPGLRPVSVSVASTMAEGAAGARGSPLGSLSGFFSTSVAAAAASGNSMAGPAATGAVELSHGSGLSATFAAAMESGSAFGSVGGSQQRTISGADHDAGALPVGVPYARWHSAVSVLFADICGYTATSQALQPEEVMELLHTLFCKYDALLAAYGVYKVETIGDCFMAATGLETQSDGHALDMVRFGRAMIAAAAEVTNPVTGEPLQIRVGIHSGRVMSGIVGHCRARYCLFGDTVNTASRLESTGVPGRVQIAEETYALLPDEERRTWVSRGPVEMKGKGLKQTYLSAAPDGEPEQSAALAASAEAVAHTEAPLS
ncbi:hypothetical protein HXX76_004698 [Chlamydomonas incerta]|uniref:Guanylate cyclase domain-containing protein n=1 Tax=Chlamydomonas incerta TaxID=51695 RepID=A0A835TFD9_CHLIN|nr:hypothetical protein HXX76_004698 [Chlamydomonas incerta]|eukprot:KAG2439339.1 hypothetical protein HXX76_004698 [Chlamydomonas incerta]